MKCILLDTDVLTPNTESPTGDNEQFPDEHITFPLDPQLTKDDDSNALSCYECFK